MIISKKLIPSIYSNSYDMSIFTGLTDLIYNSRLVDIELLKGLHSPKLCAEESIRSLASLFNLDTDNRLAIASYRQLIKIKGTERAITSAAYICGAKSIQSITYEGDNRNILTLNIDFEDFDSALFSELSKRLLPISMIVKIEPLQTQADTSATG